MLVRLAAVPRTTRRCLLTPTPPTPRAQSRARTVCLPRPTLLPALPEACALGHGLDGSLPWVGEQGCSELRKPSCAASPRPQLSGSPARASAPRVGPPGAEKPPEAESRSLPWD